MTKIMLVEDDNNLREIYEARLSAEGYTIVSAQDGEAALALAAKERPDLIITDVMMPKISGFEMLDILRNTENLRDVKVIMLTALGQIEDSARASSLGADRYLVKSQVTLEDIIKATHEVLDEVAASASPADFVATPSVPNNPPAPAAAAAAPVPAPAPPVDEPNNEARVWQPAAAAPTEPVSAEVPAVPEAAEPIEIIEPPQSDTATVSDVDGPVDAPAAPIAVVDTPSSSDDPQTATAPEPDQDQAIDASDPDNPLMAQPTPTQSNDSTSPSEPTVEAASQPAAAEEAVIKAQIDQFLTDNSDQPADEPNNEARVWQPAAAESNDNSDPTPADPQTPAEESDAEFAKDDATPDMGQMSIQEGRDTPSDETDAEYDKDASTPDMGELAVQPEPSDPEVLPVAEAPSVDALPGDPISPTQTYELPPVQEPAAQIEVPPLSNGDQIVNDAVNDMIASTSGLPPATPSPAPAPPAIELIPAQSLDADTQPPAGPTPETTPETAAEEEPSYQSDMSSHKRVIAPLGLSANQPDINQLLAMEEAKAAAQQASSYMQAPPAVQQVPPTEDAPAGAPAPQPGPGQVPPASTSQGFDPNSIAL